MEAEKRKRVGTSKFTIMKNYLSLLILVLPLLFSLNELYADNSVVVTVPTTQNYSNYLPPLKPGASYSFQISAKNNLSESCSLTLDADQFGFVRSWITITTNPITIGAGQTNYFNLKIDVPTDAQAMTYSIKIACTGSSEHYAISSEAPQQLLIVDNTPPDPPIVTTTSNSYKLLVNTWSSSDADLSSYTVINPSAGYNGIKSYSFVLKDANGTTVGTPVARNYNEYTPVIFSNLSPYTSYKINVSATNVAGNTNSYEKVTYTTPAPPSLSASNTSYVSTTLNWIAQPGATGYNVYEVVNGSNNLLNSIPITGTSFTINGLSPSSSHTYNIIALSAVGNSDRSINYSLTTLQLPHLNGGPSICSGGSTVSLSSLVSGYSTTWSKSSNLNLVTSSSTTATFSAVNTSGWGWIHAAIHAPTGESLPIDTLKVWSGKPTINPITPLAYYGYGIYNSVCNLQNYTTNIEVYGSSSVTWSRIAANPTNLSWSQSGNNISFYFYSIGQTEVFRISAGNTCGTTINDFGFQSVDCSGGGGGCDIVYSVSPNPASDNFIIVPNIPAPCEPTLQTAEFNGAITLYDSQGAPKKKIKYKHYEQASIETSGLQNGMYILEIYDGKKVVNKNILISK